jgi:hypothetical protein
MKNVKMLLTAALLAVGMSASAQFTNASSRSNGFSGGPVPGYKGFFEAGYTVGLGDYGIDRIAIASTTHGYQINPNIFVGGGIAVNYFSDSEAWNLPIFGNFRYTFLDNKISPFIDAKVGYAILDVDGFYFNPSVGCRFGLSDTFALTASMGYEVLSADYGYARKNCGGLAFRVGIEF